MAILYRAIWSDPASEDSAERFTRMKDHAWSWAHEGEVAQPLQDGPTSHPLRQGGTRAIAVRAFTTPEGVDAFELATEDASTTTTTIWSTTVRLLHGTDELTVLVENRMDSDIPTEEISRGRPRVVHHLLQESTAPTFGGSRVAGEVMPFPAAGVGVLTEVLASDDREMPVIVCTEPDGQDADTWGKTAEVIAKRSEGVALVVTLDRAATATLAEALGTNAVHSGGIRVYLPTPVTRWSEGRQHRFYSARRLHERREIVIDRVVDTVAELSTRRRMPRAFRVFSDPVLAAPVLEDGAASADVLAALREEWSELVDQAESDLQGLETERDALRSERDDAQEELASSIAHLNRLREVLREDGKEHLLFATEHDTGDTIPDTVEDIDEAITAAQGYLQEWLAVPDGARRDLAKLTTTSNASAWGNTTWRGLRALAGYARDRREGWEGGGFWQWCESGRPGTWPATVKKLSMTESDSVVHSSRHYDARLFPVEETLSSDGRIHMVAHLKIAEGGGNLAPRVYFLDDTGGATGKIHVGFVGPHYLVPNKSTN
ncbi:hypothetical protein [Brachybacterium sp. P6-10-X1]|uniref:hypothetical protein n=1 Tax=Brachybacterium sp. P6-10-X1 TaxID=1903186 RepID=UPI0009F87CC1|nr:hypothetical protein [Brachybacterium sp. P6-10-X1]